MRAYVAVSSNDEAKQNIAIALERLQNQFSELKVSSIYQNAAYGVSAPDYYNLAVSFILEDKQQDIPTLIGSLIKELKGIEQLLGRLPKSCAQGKVSIDLDLLYVSGFKGCVAGYELPSPDILKHSFVLKPLAEIAAHEIEPCSQRCYSELWDTFDQRSHPLVQVDFISVH